MADKDEKVTAKELLELIKKAGKLQKESLGGLDDLEPDNDSSEDD